MNSNWLTTKVNEIHFQHFSKKKHDYTVVVLVLNQKDFDTISSTMLGPYT